MAETSNILVDILEYFEDFIGKLERRRDELEDLKDELLLYNDTAFMASIHKGLAELEKGEVILCEDEAEMDKLFKSL